MYNHCCHYTTHHYKHRIAQTNDGTRRRSLSTALGGDTHEAAIKRMAGESIIGAKLESCLMTKTTEKGKNACASDVTGSSFLVVSDLKHLSNR